MTNHKKSGCAAVFLHLFGNTSKPATKQQKTLPLPPIVPANFEEESQVPSSIGQKEEPLPYRLRDDFLSPAEMNFYRVLSQTVGPAALICPKVSLGDLFYARSGAFNTNQAYRNKIDRKHVDFLLRDPQSLRPVAGIELDDGSHFQPDRQERDRFIEQVFSAAGLPLIRQPVRAAYNTRDLAALLKDRAGIAADKPPSDPASPLASLTAALDQEIPTPSDGPAAQPDTSAAPALSATSFPLCPNCGQAMVLRTVKKDGPHKGNQFWGCRDYPHCRGMRPFN